MNIDLARAIAVRKLDAVEDVGNNIIRGVLSYKQKPCAAFYIDVSDSVEQVSKDLIGYQDRILGGRYFNSEAWLRWNTYLILTARKDRFHDDKFLQLRSVIESDRRYARKFVVPEDELEECLSGRLASNVLTAGGVKDIIHTWHEQLNSAGLGDVLLPTENISKIVKGIAEKSRVSRRVGADGAIAPRQVEDVSAFLRELSIERFREFPRKKVFDFRTFNLVRGTNGVGKTSLLEAIEFLYCRGNKRSDSPEGAEVRATLKGGEQTLVTSLSSKLQVYRDRNLAWYGKHDIKANRITDSFSQFNFLDTDAAVRLSQSGDVQQIQSNLSQLLIGAEPARVWDQMGRVFDELVSQARAEKKQIEALAVILESQKERIVIASAGAKQSDELAAVLREQIVDLRWKGLPKDKRSASDSRMTALGPIASLLASIDLSLKALRVSGRTPAEVSALVAKTKSLMPQAKQVSSSAEKLRRRIREQETETKKWSLRRKHLLFLDQIVTSGVLDIAEQTSTGAAEIDKLRSEIGEVEPRDAADEELGRGSASLAELDRRLEREISELDGTVRLKQREREVLRGHQSTFKSLRRELSATAIRLIDMAHDKSACPLCESQVGHARLVKRLSQIGDDRYTNQTSVLETEIVQTESKREAASRRLLRVKALMEFSVRNNMDTRNTSISLVLEGLRSRVARLKKRSTSVERAMRKAQNLNVSAKDLERATILASGIFGKSESKVSNEAIAVARVACDKALKEIAAKRVATVTELEQLEGTARELASELGLPQKVSLENIEDESRARYESLKRIIEDIANVRVSVEFPEDGDTRLFAAKAEASVRSQEKLLKALEAESQAGLVLGNANDALRKAQVDMDSAQAKYSNLVSASKTLELVRRENSLAAATRDVLLANEARISDLFSRIHAPHEYEVALGAGKELRHVITQKEATLAEISTGQRAAFALSVFLAMNQYAKAAPPVILIDDPVAHVDDLNTLSFLDVLRDIAVSGNRQIFFATADDKLADLIADKFSFLGSELLETRLERSASSAQ